MTNKTVGLFDPPSLVEDVAGQKGRKIMIDFD